MSDDKFVIAEVMPGKLNAMVKNAMRQMEIDDPNEAVRRVNSGEWIITKSPKPSILRLISSGKRITIRATDGQRTIAQAKDVFTWGIDPDFVNWGLDVPGKARPETPVEVHEMVQDGNFAAILASLGRGLDSLCFEQDQIIAFVEDHKKLLRKGGYATFFLLKVGDKFFVVSVFLASGEGPRAFVDRSSDDHVWTGGCRRRFVFPQLNLEP